MPIARIGLAASHLKGEHSVQLSYRGGLVCFVNRTAFRSPGWRATTLALIFRPNVDNHPSTNQAHEVLCTKLISGSGAEGARTPDIRLAKAALSQLSYSPRLANNVSLRALELANSLVPAGERRPKGCSCLGNIFYSCGRGRPRTGNLLDAIEVLSQLSYVPI